MNHDDNDDDKGNCCICLEPLLSSSGSPSLGATVPCGHVFHQACLHQLAAYGCASKCPMCNTSPVTVCKLYLDVPSVAMAATVVPQVIDLANESEDIDDATATITTEKYQQVRQQAVHYHQKWQTAKENLTKQAQRLQRHAKEMQAMETTMENMQAEMQQQRSLHGRERRQVETLRLDKVQLERRVDTLQIKLQRAEREAQQARTALQQASQRHAAELQKAASDSMQELQVLSQQHPALVQQIRTLTAENTQYQKLVQQYVPEHARSISGKHATSFKKKQQSALLARLGRAVVPNTTTSSSAGTKKRPLSATVSAKPSTATTNTTKQSSPTTVKQPPPPSRNERARTILSELDRADQKAPPVKPKMIMPQHNNKKLRLSERSTSLLGASAKRRAR